VRSRLRSTTPAGVWVTISPRRGEVGAEGVRKAPVRGDYPQSEAVESPPSPDPHHLAKRGEGERVKQTRRSIPRPLRQPPFPTFLATISTCTITRPLHSQTTKPPHASILPTRHPPTKSERRRAARRAALSGHGGRLQNKSDECAIRRQRLRAASRTQRVPNTPDHRKRTVRGTEDAARTTHRLGEKPSQPSAVRGPRMTRGSSRRPHTDAKGQPILNNFDLRISLPPAANATASCATTASGKWQGRIFRGELRFLVSGGAPAPLRATRGRIVPAMQASPIRCGSAVRGTHKQLRPRGVAPINHKTLSRKREDGAYPAPMARDHLCCARF